MKLWWEGIRAWWRRRSRGFVAAPALHGGRGTSWQEHKGHEIGFTCQGVRADGQPCGQVLAFMSTDYVIRAREHVDSCMVGSDVVNVGNQLEGYCACPVTDARYVKICPGCHLGHWKDGTPQPFVKGKMLA
jgi:hypothetical protein